MSEHYYPPRGAVKSIQEVNATITVGGTGNRMTFTVALAATVVKSKSVFIPNAGTGSYGIAGPLSSAAYWFRHWGTSIGADGASLEVDMQDGGASSETVRIAGYVVEYY